MLSAVSKGHLLELARQVAAPRQARRCGQGRSLDASADHSGGLGRIRLRRSGPVADAMVRAGQDCGGPAGAGANARVIGSERRNGASVNSKRGFTARRTASHAS
jgi:hypothetical protein